MAKRFGGEFSPKGDAQDRLPGPAPRGAYHKARVRPAGARSNVMFLPPIPMVFMAINDGALGLTLALTSAAILILGAWLLREGLKAEAAFDERKVARAPAMPRKIFAACLAAIGIAIAAFKNDGGLVAPILFGLVTLGLHVAAFGIDPLRSKGMEGIDTFQQDRVAKVVDEAETYLSEMTDALKRAGDRHMETRLDTFKTRARELIRTVEEDPRDLTAARKYLGVYLMGARDATVKFADIYSRNENEAARKDYAALLDDLSENFAARTEKLLTDDRSDLNVEIEVLRDRLSREGVRLAPTEDS